MKLLIWFITISFGVLTLGCSSVPMPDRAEEHEIQYPFTCGWRIQGGHKVIVCP